MVVVSMMETSVSVATSDEDAVAAASISNGGVSAGGGGVSGGMTDGSADDTTTAVNNNIPLGIESGITTTSSRSSWPASYDTSATPGVAGVVAGVNLHLPPPPASPTNSIPAHSGAI